MRISDLARKRSGDKFSAARIGLINAESKVHVLPGSSSYLERAKVMLIATVNACTRGSKELRPELMLEQR
jgi:hypothetical protein